MRHSPLKDGMVQKSFDKTPHTTTSAQRTWIETVYPAMLDSSQKRHYDNQPYVFYMVHLDELTKAHETSKKKIGIVHPIIVENHAILSADIVLKLIESGDISRDKPRTPVFFPSKSLPRDYIYKYTEPVVSENEVAETQGSFHLNNNFIWIVLILLRIVLS